MNRAGVRIAAIVVAVGVIGLALVLLEGLAPTASAGPLALVEPQAGSPQARTEGVLEITDECVSLVHPDGSRTVVIWIRDAATWNATDRSIAVTNADGGQLTLHTGDPIVLGGGGGPAATIDNAGKWVRRPGEACEPPNWFLAVDVEIAQPS